MTGASTSRLNDTGITWCANDTTNNLACPVTSHPGQDGDHGRDALARAGQLQKVGGGKAGLDFTKLDANGNALPASASSWSCVRDNHTGLIWEVKTTSGLRGHVSTRYIWYDPDHSTNGGIDQRGQTAVSAPAAPATPPASCRRSTSRACAGPATGGCRRGGS
ncbi:MAG: hypothetical protein U5O69_04740 [Candidatus Competibacteraceae bacterium]|nr:hypothetical protein [Candidatus Competibacteraceae bacterium]